MPYPLDLPAGLLESVYTKCRAEIVSFFSRVYKLFLSFLGSKDYQLVTWSRDQTLRMWRIDSQLQRVRKHFCSGTVDDFLPGWIHLPFLALPVIPDIQELQTQQPAAASLSSSAPAQKRPKEICDEAPLSVPQKHLWKCKATLLCSSKRRSHLGKVEISYCLHCLWRCHLHGCKTAWVFDGILDIG